MRNLPHGFDICLVNVKTMRKIVQIFVAFSEKLNFKQMAKMRPPVSTVVDRPPLRSTYYNNMYIVVVLMPCKELFLEL